MIRRAAVPDKVVGNVYDKYGTTNPVARALMRGFLRTVTELYRRLGPATVLEVGCGEGDLAHHLVTHAPRPARFVACDIDLGAARRGLDPLIELRQASAYDLPFEDRAFDLVVCCEVLEHLLRPEQGLAETARVARRAVVVSTPREPLWRLLNVAGGRYLKRLGNTPGHVQHFSTRGLRDLAERSLRVVDVRTPVPWTVLQGEPLPVSRAATSGDRLVDHERQSDEREGPDRHGRVPHRRREQP